METEMRFVMLMRVDRCETSAAARGQERRRDPRVLHGSVGAVCQGQWDLWRVPGLTVG